VNELMEKHTVSTERQTDRWTDGLMVEWTNRLLGGLVNELMERRTVWTDGQRETDGDKQTDDGQTERHRSKYMDRLRDRQKWQKRWINK